jgi:hypothetical protein
MDQLPIELILEIAFKCNLIDYAAISMTCKHCRRIRGVRTPNTEIDKYLKVYLGDGFEYFRSLFPKFELDDQHYMDVIYGKSWSASPIPHIYCMQPQIRVTNNGSYGIFDPLPDEAEAMVQFYKNYCGCGHELCHIYHTSMLVNIYFIDRVGDAKKIIDKSLTRLIYRGWHPIFIDPPMDVNKCKQFILDTAPWISVNRNIRYKVFVGLHIV